MSFRVRFCAACVARIIVLGIFLALAPGASFAQGAHWPSAGQNLSNTRHQMAEKRIAPESAATLTTRWVLNTGGDVSATPAVDGEYVYFPDWAGNLYKADRSTGAVIWTDSIPALTGVAGNFSRTTPLIRGDHLIVGDQGGRLFSGARIMALEKEVGQLMWSTVIDSHPSAIVTQSPIAIGDTIIVGVASYEEVLAALVPGYQCCTFRGSVVALDADTGQILWRTYMTPAGYAGAGVWGSTPAIDVKRNRVYISTGNNSSVPQEVRDCVAAANGDSAAEAACSAPDNLFDSIVALDYETGQIIWATRTVPYDTWTVACALSLPQCPDPAGPSYDFAQGPMLFKVQMQGKPRDYVGAGQKSGRFYTLDAETGLIVWTTVAGPAGLSGGLMWGSATDGNRVYTSNANSDGATWTLPTGATTAAGVWSALDAATGAVLWQTANPDGGAAGGAVSSANGVVFACSQDPAGGMYALDGATGNVLWGFESGGSCNSGPAISQGTVYWGSGYGSAGPPNTVNNKFYAFQLASQP